jgi:hypothetical protein
MNANAIATVNGFLIFHCAGCLKWKMNMQGAKDISLNVEFSLNSKSTLVTLVLPELQHLSLLAVSGILAQY